MNKPYAESAERNRDPILAILRARFSDRRHVLEVGSGTGQHAVYFAAALPHLCWQTSDCAANLPGIRLWLEAAALGNTPPPLCFDVNEAPPAGRFDAVFSANTLHIMSWAEVERFISALPELMTPGALLTIYGPFNYAGRFTSPSNERFDAMLRRENPLRGVRDFEAVDALARAHGLNLVDDAAMPVNNRCLTWQRGKSLPEAGRR